ncbi:MAG TPA: cytochrome c biogenesis protein CcsA [Pyrinomonadaceae bacterium]|jgi:ABC-type transport system involved in cytochrome c biogenesis permease subunit
MSEAINQTVIPTSPNLNLKGTLRSYLPALLALTGAVLMLLLRIQLGGASFMSDGALMMLALACYLTAATFHLTNLYAPSNWAQRLGLWLATSGVFFNLASWLVRWVNARDHELEIILRNGGEMPWVWRYIPFANLYDLSLAFAFGAGITTLLIAHRPNFRFLGALTLPLASLILLLARFIGNDFINLPPVLDSYWRPIHVGIASLSYGVALVCFSIAVIYLLKDRVKPEAMAIWSSIFALAVFATVSRYSVFTAASYRASTMLTGSKQQLPLRVEIPYVGPMLVLCGLLLLGVIISFGIYLSKEDERARLWGHRLLKLALVTQAIAIALLVGQVKSMTNLPSRINANQYPQFGKWMAEQQGLKPQEIAQLGAARLEQAAASWTQENGSRLTLSLNANPVELAALITALVGTLFVILFSFRTERLREVLPPLEKLDSLMYKTAGVTFAGLVMLLITGAVWANESWGAYWSWDSKEVGAFVAMLTYAGYLHTRIAHSWSGRKSAYFAIVGFLLIIFTYLGVSYLLPGLHSYA